MKRRVEYILYQGEQFTLEWYHDAAGTSEVREYFEALDEEQQLRLLYLVKRMGDSGKIHDKTKFRNEGDQIYAFKPKPERFLCFFCKDRKIILTNAFTKNQKKLPSREKDKAFKLKQDYETRVEKGTYYA